MDTLVGGAIYVRISERPCASIFHVPTPVRQARSLTTKLLPLPLTLAVNSGQSTSPGLIELSDAALCFPSLGQMLEMLRLCS